MVGGSGWRVLPAGRSPKRLGRQLGQRAARRPLLAGERLLPWEEGLGEPHSALDQQPLALQREWRRPSIAASSPARLRDKGAGFMARLTLDSVTKTYPNGTTAVDSLSLDVPDGGFAVLVGPSGCGKSMTLRIVVGLERVDSGTVRIGDRVVNDVPPQRRDIAVVFQNYALYPHMSVAKNMGFGLKMRKASGTEIRERLLETSRVLGIEHLLDRYPAQLSGGERQRVAVGRAIVRDPTVFLLDEPLSNLDAQLRTEMRIELRRIQQKLAATFMFVTHDQVEAMTLADLLAVMRDGILQQKGSPDEIYQRPTTIFVAGFIGSPKMNFLDGSLARENGRFVVATQAARVPIIESAGQLPPDIIGNVVIGIRPERIRLDPDGELAFGVEVVEALGGQTFVYGSLGPSLQLAAAIDPSLRPAPRRPLASCHTGTPCAPFILRRASGSTKEVSSRRCSQEGRRGRRSASASQTRASSAGEQALELAGSPEEGRRVSTCNAASSVSCR